MEDINFDDASQKAIIPIDSADLLAEPLSKTILSVLKTAQYFMTDDAFDLEKYVDKIEPMIEESKEFVALANSFFIVVSQETLQEVKKSLELNQESFEEVSKNFTSLQ